MKKKETKDLTITQRNGNHTEERQSHRGTAITQRNGNHTEERQSANARIFADYFSRINQRSEQKNETASWWTTMILVDLIIVTVSIVSAPAAH